MIIKCPECSTGYNIPEAALGDKPRKMKCAKCKHLFTVTRRSNQPPEGYVEFTGAQKLPPEFAFLQASVPPAAKKAPSIPVASAKEVDKTPAVQPPAPAQTPPPAPASTGKMPPPMPQTAVAPSAPVAETPAAKAALAELQQGGGTPIGNSLPAETMFGSNSSAWEVEAPMELGSYAVEEAVAHRGHQAVGKIFFGVIIAIVIFFIFVAFRNGWSLSLSELPEQVSFAFSSEALEEIPEAAQNIEATVVSKKVVTSSHGTYLSVSGEVINNNLGRRSQVIIRGRLYDKEGNLKGEARMPCGRAVDDNAIQKTALGGIQQQFSDNGVLHNCQIGPNDSKLFQVVFEDVPEEYNADFEVKVKAVAAVAQ